MSIAIKNIKVKQLFNKYDYDINLDNGEDIAVIIAPNGCGKTTIFKFLDALFNGSPESFIDVVSVPFEEFSCELTNGDVYRIFHGEESDKTSISREAILGRALDKLGLNIVVEVKTLGKRRASRAEYKYDFRDILIHKVQRGVEQMEMYLRRTPQMGWDIDDLVAKDKSIIYLCWDEIIRRTRMRPESIKINFIGANRLKSIKVVRDREEERDEDPITLASRYVRQDLRIHLERYNVLRTEAQNELPKKYLVNKNDPFGYEAFSKRWNDYSSELAKYSELGFLAQEDAELTSITKEDYESHAMFLDSYIDVFENTIAPLEEIYSKYKLFKDIFDGRNAVTDKTMKISRNGIEIFDNGRGIKLTRLSSGEKNDLIMFYRMIFRSTTGGVILVDEPEISLHISWQEEYLDKLIEICKMNDMQAIIATHSPHIINGHFENIINLGE